MDAFAASFGSKVSLLSSRMYQGCKKLPSQDASRRLLLKLLFCCRFNVSERMYNEFLRPTLLVGLFAPPEDLSAAAVLNTLYFYGRPKP